MPPFGTSLGSFPNSRIKPRPATSAARTTVQTIGIGANFVFPANINRTYLSIRNESSTDDLRYSYAASPGPLPANGFLVRRLEAVDIETQEAVTVWNVGAAAIQVSFDEGQG